MILLPCLAAFLSAPLSAQTHLLGVKVSDGKTAYVQTVKLPQGGQANVVGPVVGKDGSRRDMIVNVLLGGSDLSYQLELSQGRGAAGQVIQAQGQLSIRPGGGLTVVECGRWRIDLSLDAAGKSPAAWDASGSANVRVSAELSRGREKVLCRQVLRPGSQGNVVDGRTQGGRKLGFIMNILPAVTPRGAVELQYQLEYTRPGAPSGSFQVQNQETLAFGRRTSSESSGYRLDLLVEGAAPRASGAGAGPAQRNAPEPAEEKKAVPLLR